MHDYTIPSLIKHGCKSTADSSWKPFPLSKPHRPIFWWSEYSLCPSREVFHPLPERWNSSVACVLGYIHTQWGQQSSRATKSHWGSDLKLHMTKQVSATVIRSHLFFRLPVTNERRGEVPAEFHGFSLTAQTFTVTIQANWLILTALPALQKRSNNAVMNAVACRGSGCLGPSPWFYAPKTVTSPAFRYSWPNLNSWVTLV